MNVTKKVTKLIKRLTSPSPQLNSNHRFENYLSLINNPLLNTISPIKLTSKKPNVFNNLALKSMNTPIKPKNNQFEKLIQNYQIYKTSKKTNSNKIRTSFVRLNSNLNNLYQRNSMNLSQEKNDLIFSVMKYIDDKTESDIFNIKKFLIECNLLEKIKFENCSEDVIEKILLNCCMNLRYKYIKEGHTLFHIDDENDKLYIILKGKIGVNKPIRLIKNMTPFEYFQNIYNLFIQKEKYLLKITLEENVDIFKIKEEMLPKMNIIIALILISKNRNKNERKSLSSILNSCYVDQNIYNKYYFCNPNINELINSHEFNYELLCDQENVINVSVFEYHLFYELAEKNFIEEKIYEKRSDNINYNDKRTFTAKIIQNTHLLYLKYNNFITLINDEREKIINSDIKFLSEDFFFNIKSYLFHKDFKDKYFHYFNYVEYDYNQYIMKENEFTEYIYFLKEGNIEISMNKSLIQLHALIKELYSIIESKSSLSIYNFNDSQYNFIKNNKILSQFQKEKAPTKIMNSVDNVNLIKLIQIEKKDCFGIENAFYNIKNYYSIKVVSNKAKVYKLNIKDISKIISNENAIKINYENEARNKVEFILIRLFKLTQIKLDLEISKKNFSEKKKYYENKINTKYFKNIPNKKLLICSYKDTPKKELYFKNSIFNNYITQNNINKKDKKIKNQNYLTFNSFNYKNDISKNNINNSTSYSNINNVSNSTPKILKEFSKKLIINNNKINEHLSVKKEEMMLNKVQKELNCDNLFINKINKFPILNMKNKLKISKNIINSPFKFYNNVKNFNNQS